MKSFKRFIKEPNELDEGLVKAIKDVFKKKKTMNISGWKTRVHSGKHPDVKDISAKGNILFAIDPKSGKEHHVASGNLSGSDIKKFKKIYGLK